MILVDSWAWIKFDHATESSVDLRLTSLIEEGGYVIVTKPVIMEVVTGARTDARSSNSGKCWRHLNFSSSMSLPTSKVLPRSTAPVARPGFTPRGMIALVAWRHGASLLAQDVNMARLAKVVGIKMAPASPLPPPAS